MFTQALSIHLASGSLIKGKAGVVRRCSAEQKLRRARKTRFGTKEPMSESAVTQSVLKTASPAPGSVRNTMHAGGSDLRMLAQVEKWMAVIREIDRKQQELRFRHSGARRNSRE